MNEEKIVSYLGPICRFIVIFFIGVVAYFLIDLIPSREGVLDIPFSQLSINDILYPLLKLGFSVGLLVWFVDTLVKPKSMRTFSDDEWVTILVPLIVVLCIAYTYLL